MTEPIDPRRRQQLGVRDDLATPEQLTARHQGIYDPRPASGAHVARRVELLCGSCGERLAEVHDFERRSLTHALQTNRWYRQPNDLKCRNCYEPLDYVGIDYEAIARKLQQSRERNKVERLKIGIRLDADRARAIVNDALAAANSQEDDDSQSDDSSLGSSNM